LLSSGLNFSFWKDAMEYGVFIYNRTPHSSIGFKTPWEVFYNCTLKKIPNFHVFGSIAYYHVPKELRRKLDSTSKRCLFLGYNNTSTTVLCLENLTIKSVRTADVLDCEFLDKEEM